MDFANALGAPEGLFCLMQVPPAKMQLTERLVVTKAVSESVMVARSGLACSSRAAAGRAYLAGLDGRPMNFGQGLVKPTLRWEISKLLTGDLEFGLSFRSPLDPHRRKGEAIMRCRLKCAVRRLFNHAQRFPPKMQSQAPLLCILRQNGQFLIVLITVKGLLEVFPEPPKPARVSCQ